MPPTPDHVPCRHCGKPISWDEMCWTHDHSGFQECGTAVTGGTPVPDLYGIPPPPGTHFVLDPDVRNDGDTRLAEPEGEWE
jgi:hypothetical protein